MTPRNTPLPLSAAQILVVGAGIMGAGIAQVAAQAGHQVLLHDAREGAAADAKTKLAKDLGVLAAKGKRTAEEVAQTLARITPVDSLVEAAQVRLVVEAIIEKLDAKRALLRELEGIVAVDCVLATNTSSISVTAIANGLERPGRLVGMHFFNPVPLMRLVEVVSGLQTDPAVAEAVVELSMAWGKVPVHAKSTPGFIVNRIARPFYAEALGLLQERAASPEALDACLRAAGFRMGPCELMDLIGHDTNFSVTQSVFDANFYDKRFVPSLVQRELVDAGLLGRKSGRGFYVYPNDGAALSVTVHDAPQKVGAVIVHGRGPIADWLAMAVSGALTPMGLGVACEVGSKWIGLQIDAARLVLSDGRCAAQMAADTGCRDLAVFDRPMRLPLPPDAALAYALAQGASEVWRVQAAAWLAALGVTPLPLADAPGLVVARTVAMLINEAADAVQQGVCTIDGADAAMKLGVNYPAGPFEWLARWSASEVIALLDTLDVHYRGERYRVSSWLRRRAWQDATQGVAR